MALLHYLKETYTWLLFCTTFVLDKPFSYSLCTHSSFFFPLSFPEPFFSQLWFIWPSRTVLLSGLAITTVTLTLALCVSDFLWPLGTMASSQPSSLSQPSLSAREWRGRKERVMEGGGVRELERGSKKYVCLCMYVNTNDQNQQGIAAAVLLHLL